jgi:hypothetical protein
LGAGNINALRRNDVGQPLDRAGGLTCSRPSIIASARFGASPLQGALR